MFPILQFLKGFFQGPSKEELKEFKEKVEKGNFGKISFPILMDEDGDLNIVSDWESFVNDADHCFFPFSPRFRLIDSRGALWTWAYDDDLKLNVPGSYVRWVGLAEVKAKFKRCIKNQSSNAEVLQSLEEARDFISLFKAMAAHF